MASQPNVWRHVHRGDDQTFVHPVGVECGLGGPNQFGGLLYDGRFPDAPEQVIEDRTVAGRKYNVTVPGDPINHPSHYTSHPSGVECITITEHMGFNLGNALKYVWRADLKGDAIQDLEKARWYIDRELEKRRTTG